MTARRYDHIAARAADLLTKAGGVGHLDSISTAAARLVLAYLTHTLKDAENVTRKTAKKHIDRACLAERNPNYTPPKWGGYRPQGQKEETE